MANPFYLIWQQAGTLLRGNDGVQWVDGELGYPIVYPGVTTNAQNLTLQSSAAFNLGLDTLINVCFFLTGSDVAMVQEEWPYLGDAYIPARPETNGGFEISFDNGSTWIRFNKTTGYQADRSTWIPLSELAVGSSGFAGVISPYDSASVAVRFVIPPGVTISKILDIQLSVDFEVV